jgi:hypothetical protein
MPDVNRTRSDAETAFNLMRTLAIARFLWAGGGALPIADLAALVGAEPGQIALAIEQLCDEGVAERCADDAALRLTERMAKEIFRVEERDRPRLRRARMAATMDAAP